MIKQKWLFWRAGFYLANQSNLKGFQKALIGWKKAGPPKKPLLLWLCKQAIQYMPKNAYFLEKSYKIAAAFGVSAPEPPLAPGGFVLYNAPQPCFVFNNLQRISTHHILPLTFVIAFSSNFSPVVGKVPHVQQKLIKKWQHTFIWTSNILCKEGTSGACTLGAGFEGAPTHFAVK